MIFRPDAERGHPGEERKNESENDEHHDRVLGRESFVAPEDGQAHAISSHPKQSPPIPENVTQRFQVAP